MEQGKFDTWARAGIAEAARCHREYVAAMTAAIEAAETPGDAGVLMNEMVRETSRDYHLMEWLALLPETTGREVHYDKDAGTYSVRDVPPPPSFDEQCPF